MEVARKTLSISELSQFVIGNPDMYAWYYYRDGAAIKSTVALISQSFKDDKEALNKTRDFLIRTAIGQVSILLLHSAISYKDVTKVLSYMPALNIMDIARMSNDLSLVSDYYTTDNEEFINDLTMAKKDLYKNWKNEMTLEEFRNFKHLIKTIIRNKDQVGEIRDLLEKDMMRKVNRLISKYFDELDTTDLKSPANPYKDIIDECVMEQYPYTANNEVRNIVSSIMASPIEAKEYYEHKLKVRRERLHFLKSIDAPPIIMNSEEVQKYYSEAYFKLAEEIVDENELSGPVSRFIQKFTQKWNDEKFCFE